MKNIRIIDDNFYFVCVYLVHTELLYIHATDLSDELRQSLIALWQHIRISLKRFDYYFGHFTEQQVNYGENEILNEMIILFIFRLQIIECCTFSKIRQYELESVIYDEDENKRNTSFFLLSGQCSILQYLKMNVCIHRLMSGRFEINLLLFEVQNS